MMALSFFAKPLARLSPMQINEYRDPGNAYTWVDVLEPTPDDLRKLATTYQLHPAAVEDCMEAWHLPKYERFGDTLFLILRAQDERDTVASQANVIQQITRKIAVFIKQDLVLTIHRGQMPFYETFARPYRERAHINGGRPVAKLPVELLLYLIEAVGLSYDNPLSEAERVMDSYEYRVFSEPDRRFNFQEFYFFKRRNAMTKKMLRMQLDLLQRLDAWCTGPMETIRQDVRESIEESYFVAEELMNDASNLMNMYLNISAFRTNAIIRVLTIFSVFFLPLTFIAGIYGMNFEFMPELRWRMGYPFSIALMAGVVAFIYWWFKRNKWL